MFKIKFIRPSRKIIMAAAIAALIIFIALYSRFGRGGNGPATLKTGPGEAKTINLGEMTLKDSDRDGVPDWEEFLWGTDPNNPDTYGKSIGDLAEINKKKSLLGNQIAKEKGGEPTETEIFASNLISYSAALRQSGNLNEDTIGELSSGITENIDKRAAEKAYYYFSDLKIYETSTTSIEIYRDKMIQIADEYGESGLGNELFAIAEAIDEKNPEKLKILSGSIYSYRKILNEILAAEVPENLAANHLVMANALRNVIESLNLAEKIFSDPLAGLIEVTRYRNATNSFMAAVDRIETYYANRDKINGNETASPNQ